MRSLARLPLISIEIRREEIPIETMSPRQVPDKEWRYVDKQRHGHFWKGEELPTLAWVVTGTCWVGDEYDGDEYEIGEWRCRYCEEVVVPGKRAEYGPRSIPGPTTYLITINDETFSVTPEEYARSVERWAGALRGKEVPKEEE